MIDVDQYLLHDTKEMTNDAIVIGDALLHQQLRRLMNVPKFDVFLMAVATGISVPSLYAYRRGTVNAPKEETLIKMIRYLIPEAHIVPSRVLLPQNANAAE